MPSLKTPYGTLFYAQTGKTDQKPVILLHGAASSHLTWGAELRRIPEKRVIALDLPGHGRSEGKSYNAISDYANAVLSFLDAMDIESLIAVGHSMGGAIAQTLALSAPQRLAGLVLIGTGAKLPVNLKLLEMLQIDLEGAINLINKWQWTVDTPHTTIEKSKALMQTVPTEIYLADYGACSRFDVVEQVHEIDVPALVIAGENDRMVDPGMGETLAMNLLNASFELVPNAGHMLHLEHSDTIAQLIQRWLEGVIT